MWAGESITFVHPENAEITADDPEAYTGSVIGQVHEPEIIEGSKLRVMGWVDVAKAQSIGGLAKDVVSKLRNGEQLSVSAGYATIGDEFTEGTFEGEEYDVIQGHIIPDHVAIFPSDEFNARCSREDGCAAPRANYMVKSNYREGQYIQWSYGDGEGHGQIIERVTEPGTCRSVDGNERCADEDTNVLVIGHLSEDGEDQNQRVVKLEDQDNISAWNAPSDADTVRANTKCSPGPCSCGLHTNAKDNTIMEEIDDEQAATLGRRVLNALGVGNNANASTEGMEQPEGDDSDTTEGDDTSASEDESETTEVSDDDVPEPEDDETVTDEEVTEESSDEEDVSESEESGDNRHPDDEDTSTEAEDEDEPTNETDTTMPDVLSIEEIAAKSAFGIATLQEWDEQQLLALEQTILENDPALREEKEESGGSGGEDMPEQEGEPNADGGMKENSEDDSQYVTTDEFSELKTMVEDAINKQNSEETERKARAVANNVEGMTEDAAKELDTDALNALYEEHGQNNANYGGVPGEVDRTPKANNEDIEDMPAGGRSNWEQRKEAGD